MTRIITFLSGKGGVGKTTISSNVAEALFAAGKKVVVVDANVTTPNLSLHYGLSESGPSLHDVLNGNFNITDVIYKTSSGLPIIPGGLSFNNLKGKIKKSLAKSLIELVGKVDYILIDASAGLGGETQLAVKASDELVIVTNPELPAVTDALKAKKMAEEYRVSLLGVVLNKVTGLDFDLKEDNIREFLELPVLGVVPHDIHVPMSIRERTPVFISYPESKSAKAIKQIVNKITGEELYIPDKEDGPFKKWLKRFLGLE
ncbi:MAG: cell division ATPase MinD [Nanoarchaeota archaeon]|nr:cell division ATPase MinD [Nanoarchaeota archaeon]